MIAATDELQFRILLYQIFESRVQAIVGRTAMADREDLVTACVQPRIFHEVHLPDKNNGEDQQENGDAELEAR